MEIERRERRGRQSDGAGGVQTDGDMPDGANLLRWWFGTSAATSPGATEVLLSDAD